MRMGYLLHPITPQLDLTDDNAGQATMARLLLNTAKDNFPAVAATSEKLAVAALLAIHVPSTLVQVEDTLLSRAAYVQLLSNWHSPDKRVYVMQSKFHVLLLHCGVLGSWLGNVNHAISG